MFFNNLSGELGTNMLFFYIGPLYLPVPPIFILLKNICLGNANKIPPSSICLSSLTIHAIIQYKISETAETFVSNQFFCLFFTRKAIIKLVQNVSRHVGYEYKFYSTPSQQTHRQRSIHTEMQTHLYRWTDVCCVHRNILYLLIWNNNTKLHMCIYICIHIYIYVCITVLTPAVPAPGAELIQTHRDIQPPLKSLVMQFKISCKCQEK